MTKALYYGTKVIGQIPSDWGQVKVDQNLVDVLSGFACAKKNAVADGLPHLRPFNLSNDGEVTLANGTVNIPFDFKPNLERYQLQAGDVLYNNTNSVELVGKTGLVREPIRAAFSNHIARLRVKNWERLDPRWLAVVLRNLHLQGFFAANCNKWIGQAGFSVSALSNVEIPLPDIDTQRFLMSRTEHLLRELLGLREIQGTVIRDTEQLMSSILAYYFKEIAVSQDSSQKIGKLTTVTSGGTPARSSKAFYRGTIPWVKTGELRDNKLFETEEHITRQAINASNAKIYPKGTLLIAMYGQGQTRGRTAILGIEAASNQACCAIYPNPNVFDETYLQFWFVHKYAELRRQSETRGGSQPNLNQGIIKALMPPLPDVDVQRRYAALFEQARTEIADIQQIQIAHKALFAKTEAAILAEAFKGGG